MGMHAAHCMSAKLECKTDSDQYVTGSKDKYTSNCRGSAIYEDLGSSTIFDVFTHVTRFFNYKVCPNKRM
jgi:hypothetical protein